MTGKKTHKVKVIDGGSRAATISVTFWKSLDLRKRDQIDRARDTATPTPRMQVTKKNVKTAPGAGLTVTSDQRIQDRWASLRNGP